MLTDEVNSFCARAACKEDPELPPHASAVYQRLLCRVPMQLDVCPACTPGASSCCSPRNPILPSQAESIRSQFRNRAHAVASSCVKGQSHIEPRCASTIGSSSFVMSLPRNCSFIMLNMHMPAATPPAGTCHTAGDVGKLLSMDLQDAKHGQKSDLWSGSSACSW